MGTPDLAVPTLLEIVGADMRSRRLYARAENRREREEVQVSGREQARRFVSRSETRTLRNDEAVAEFRAPSRSAVV